MVWVIVAIAIAVMGLAAIATSGRLGEMPPPEDENYGGRIPEGELDPDKLALVRFPVARNGYSQAEVDAFIASVRADEWTGERPSFGVERRGYRMAEVDGVLDRIGQMRNNRDVSPEESPGHEEVREHNGSDEATYG